MFIFWNAPLWGVRVRLALSLSLSLSPFLSLFLSLLALALSLSPSLFFSLFLSLSLSLFLSLSLSLSFSLGLACFVPVTVGVNVVRVPLLFFLAHGANRTGFFRKSRFEGALEFPWLVLCVMFTYFRMSVF